MYYLRSFIIEAPLAMVNLVYGFALALTNVTGTPVHMPVEDLLLLHSS